MLGSGRDALIRYGVVVGVTEFVHEPVRVDLLSSTSAPAVTPRQPVSPSVCHTYLITHVNHDIEATTANGVPGKSVHQSAVLVL